MIEPDPHLSVRADGPRRAIDSVALMASYAAGVIAIAIMPKNGRMAALFLSYAAVPTA